MALKAEGERLRGVPEMKNSVEITPSPPSLNKQISFEAKRELFPSTSQHNERASSEGSSSEQILNLSKKDSQNLATPVVRKWADICDSAISSTPPTKGWAIAAASVVSKSPRSPTLSKKKESLNIVLSGDIPSGSLSFVKEVLVSRFIFAINPSFRGLERDFVCSDITNILFVDKSIVIRLCSNEAKNMILKIKS